MTHEFKLTAYAVTEPVQALMLLVSTTATRVGDEYIINGSKMWITNAGVADWFLF